MIGQTILASRDFKQFYKDTFDKLFVGLHRYAFSLLKDNELAHDTVQSVFIKWWETKKELDIQSVKLYLYTAVYRQSLNVLRNEKTKIAHYKDYSLEYTANSNNSNNVLEAKELELIIKEAIQQLPPQCRVVFEKSRLEDKRYAEIANEMNLSIKTVEAQMGKALKILRKQLKEYL